MSLDSKSTCQQLPLKDNMQLTVIPPNIIQNNPLRPQAHTYQKRRNNQAYSLGKHIIALQRYGVDKVRCYTPRWLNGRQLTPILPRDIRSIGGHHGEGPQLPSKAREETKPIETETRGSGWAYVAAIYSYLCSRPAVDRTPLTMLRPR